jgi:hypothetical protein
VVCNFPFSLLELDKEDAELLRQAKILEEEKAQYSVSKNHRKIL